MNKNEKSDIEEEIPNCDFEQSYTFLEDADHNLVYNQMKYDYDGEISISYIFIH